jgi:hypothetical protein
MPYLTKGRVGYHTATKQVTHGYPCSEDHEAGVAVKQKEQSWELGIANRAVVAVGEQFAILKKGETQIPASLVSSPAKGDPLFILEADNTLSKTTGAGKLPFGRITSVAGDNRGTPTGFIRVDMDARDSI